MTLKNGAIPSGWREVPWALQMVLEEYIDQGTHKDKSILEHNRALAARACRGVSQVRYVWQLAVTDMPELALTMPGTRRNEMIRTLFDRHGWQHVDDAFGYLQALQFPEKHRTPATPAPRRTTATVVPLQQSENSDYLLEQIAALEERVSKINPDELVTKLSALSEGVTALASQVQQLRDRPITSEAVLAALRSQ